MGKKRKSSTEVELQAVDAMESTDKLKGVGEYDHQKYGERITYDPNFKGPIEKRKCRDVLCLIIYIVFWFGMFVVCIYAVKYGDPNRLTNGVDSQGRICGVKTNSYDYSDRTKLLFLDVSRCFTVATLFKCPSYQVCVKECPKVTKAPITDYDDIICTDEVNKPDSLTVDFARDLWGLMVLSKCSPYLVDSVPVLNRCLPNAKSILETFKAGLEDAAGVMEDAGKEVPEDAAEIRDKSDTAVKVGVEVLSQVLTLGDYGEKIFHDLSAAWYWLIIGAFMSMFLALMWILFMSCFAGFFVWLTIVAGILALGALAGFMAYEYDRVKRCADDRDCADITEVEESLNVEEYAVKTRLGIAIFFASATLLMIIIVIALRNRIKIAIQIIKETSRSMRTMFYVIFFPFLTWFCLLVLFAYWAVVAVYLATSGEEVYEYPTGANDANGYPVFKECAIPADDVCRSNNATFKEYRDTQNLHYFQLYHLFGLFWGLNFLNAVGQCALAGMFAAWYWTLDKKRLKGSPLTKSLMRTLFYHAGSLAFGSLIIAIVQIIRVLLEMLDRALQERQESLVVKAIMCCLKCCFWCLEKVLKMLCKNAYIEIAVYGYGFCKAARKAFFLLMRNVLRLIAVDKVSDIILFLGKIIVTTCVVLASYNFFKDKQDEYNYYLAPVVALGIFAYAISSAFLSVYEMGIDTVFFCFLEDSERNDGSAERPYFMTKNLQKLLT